MSPLSTWLSTLFLTFSVTSALPTSERNDTLTLEARHVNACAKKNLVDPEVWDAPDHYAYKFDICKNALGTLEYTEYMQTRTKTINEGVTGTINHGPCASHTWKTRGTYTQTYQGSVPPVTTTVSAPGVIATTCPGVALTQKFPKALTERVKFIDIGPACLCQNFDTVTEIATTVTEDRAVISHIFVTVPVCTFTRYAKTVTAYENWEVTKTRAPKTVTYTSCPTPTRTSGA